MHKILIISACVLLFGGCRSDKEHFDATGTFEATEVIVSAETAGQIMEFQCEEGMQLKANQILGYIDTTQLYLKKKQLQAQIRAVLAKQPDIGTQLASIQEQIKTAQVDKQRIENLLAAGAATQKQLDDINAQIAILQKQLEAQQSSLRTTTAGISSEVDPLVFQIAQIDDQLNKSQIINPVAGTVLTKYTEQGETASPGKALYKIADLDKMYLRAYISGDQLPGIKTGQDVKVLIDNGQGSYRAVTGTITWISDEAEFTPKTIQTKDERANLVYAIKILVHNDGYIKIGMYGEVQFTKS